MGNVRKHESQGKQSERGNAAKATEVATPAAKADAGVIAELESQVAAQGNKVNKFYQWFQFELHFFTLVSCNRFEK